MSTKRVTRVHANTEVKLPKRRYVTRIHANTEVKLPKFRVMTQVFANFEVDIIEDVPAVADQLLFGGIQVLTGGMQ